MGRGGARPWLGADGRATPKEGAWRSLEQNPAHLELTGRRGSMSWDWRAEEGRGHMAAGVAKEPRPSGEEDPL